MTITEIQEQDAEAIVQKQLDAYNARDMEAFLATYEDDAELFDYPATLRTKGKQAMRERYTPRFNDVLLNALIAKRIVIGNTVIDHERVRLTTSEGPGVLNAVVIYEVRDGRIFRVSFIRGAETPGATQ